MIQEKSSEYRGSKRLSRGDIEHVLREPIDYNQDSIIYLVSTGVNRGRQTCNEVHRDVRLRLRGNRKQYEFAIGLIPSRLRPYVSKIILNVVLNIGSERLLVEVVAKTLLYLTDTLIPRGWLIVVPVEYFCP